jgi:hypothetical protein
VRYKANPRASPQLRNDAVLGRRQTALPAQSASGRISCPQPPTSTSISCPASVSTGAAGGRRELQAATSSVRLSFSSRRWLYSRRPGSLDKLPSAADLYVDKLPGLREYSHRREEKESLTLDVGCACCARAGNTGARHCHSRPERSDLNSLRECCRTCISCSRATSTSRNESGSSSGSTEDPGAAALMATGAVGLELAAGMLPAKSCRRASGAAGGNVECQALCRQHSRSEFKSDRSGRE